MGRNPLTLYILFDNMRYKTLFVKNKKEAEWIVHNEGDRVWEWYVK